MARTIAEQSVDTRLLVALLSKVSVGESVSYDVLSDQLGRRVMGGDPNVQSARHIVERDFDIVFDVLRGQGLKRLADGEIVALGDRMGGRVRRIARKTLTTIGKAKDENLSRDEIVQRNAAISMGGVLMHFATKRGMEKLESAIRMTGGALPVGKTIELFKG